MKRRLFALLASAFAVSRLTAVAPAVGQRSCQITEAISLLQELPEASGLAASRRTPGVLWSHNDSGEPVVFALTPAGAVKGRVRVTGARVKDWEDIAVGPCPQSTCLYIADIGDNNETRRTI